MAVIGTDITRACKLLSQGELVGIPTETVYGLAGNALRTDTVAKIFEVKKRPSFDPLIVHLRSGDYLENLVSEIPETARKLAQRLWPGPLTLILPRNDLVPDLVTNGMATVALRVPNHPMTLQLLARLDFPLACPSANPFGYISPTTAQHVDSQLGGDIPYILDGGPCKVGIESTIVGFEDQRPVVYRPGGVSIEEIENIAGDVLIRSSSADPLAPGMLKSHYSPKKTLIIGEIRDLLGKYGGEQAGVLSFMDYFDELGQDRQVQLSASGNLAEAAQNLFASLRKLDAMNIKYIFTELVPNQGLGIAINDRLRRAAGQ